MSNQYLTGNITLSDTSCVNIKLENDSVSTDYVLLLILLPPIGFEEGSCQEKEFLTCLSNQLNFECLGIILGNSGFVLVSACRGCKQVLI